MDQVLKFQPALSPCAASASLDNLTVPVRAVVRSVMPDGQLNVYHAESGQSWNCEYLMQGPAALGPEDRVVVLPPTQSEPGVVLGRIGRYSAPSIQSQVILEASESLTLRCGSSSVDLRADGKVMIRGEDVLVRAKGTKRIRAGTVSIN